MVLSGKQARLGRGGMGDWSRGQGAGSGLGCRPGVAGLPVATRFPMAMQARRTGRAGAGPRCGLVDEA